MVHPSITHQHERLREIDTNEFAKRAALAAELDPIPGGGVSPLSEREVQAAETKLGLKLPAQLRWFLTRYGESFYSAELLSVSNEGRGSVAAALEITNVGSGFLPVVADGCGGYYGYVLQGGRAESESIYYLPVLETEPEAEPSYSDFLELMFTAGIDYLWD